MDTIQERLSDALPFAFELPPGGMAGGQGGRSLDGAQAWDLLHRMLLVSNGPVVCRRCHESGVGRRNFLVCSA